MVKIASMAGLVSWWKILLQDFLGWGRRCVSVCVLYLVSLYLYLRICISSEFFSDFTWRPAAVCQGRELVRGHVGWESDLHSPLSSNSNSNSHLSSTLPGMITCAIFLVLALNHFNQADDAVSFETSTVCKKNPPAPTCFCDLWYHWNWFQL